MSACKCRACVRHRSSTRAAVEASWKAAEASSVADLTAPSAAGKYLAANDGLPNLAIRALPSREGDFWGRVATLLRQVSDESPSVYGEACEAHDVIPIRRSR